MFEQIKRNKNQKDIHLKEELTSSTSNKIQRSKKRKTENDSFQQDVSS